MSSPLTGKLDTSNPDKQELDGVGDRGQLRGSSGDMNLKRVTAGTSISSSNFTCQCHRRGRDFDASTWSSRTAIQLT